MTRLPPKYKLTDDPPYVFGQYVMYTCELEEECSYDDLDLLKGTLINGKVVRGIQRFAVATQYKGIRFGLDVYKQEGDSDEDSKLQPSRNTGS